MDMAREILLKLPTRDLARCSCVCRLWRDVARDPSFRALHGVAAHVVSSSGETLLVDEFHGQGMGTELSVLHATSSLKPIGRFAEALAVGYSPANACNGFLLLASAALDSPVCVFNPVTGEKLTVPAPPENEHVRRCVYAMGFSEPAATGVYKLFRLSFPLPRAPWPRLDDCYVDVYTLGDGVGVWRRHPELFQAKYSFEPPPPVLIDGKLYVVIEGEDMFGAPDRKMLVIDVVSEVHTWYYLPRMVVYGAAAVHAFELSGELCVAIRAIGRRQVGFWVLRQLEVQWLGWRRPDWERRHTFYLDADGEYGDKPCCAWIDGGDGMLCYRFGDRVYKYDTTKKKKKKKKKKRQMKLRVTPLWWKWNVYGGFRPSLVSPHAAFTSAGSLLQDHREKQEQLQQHTMQQSSKKRCPPDCSENHHGAKRIREHF